MGILQEFDDTKINMTNGNMTVFQTSVIALSLSSSLLSVIGSVVIFGTYITIAEIRTITRKLIVCLTVADFLTASGYILGASSFITSGKGNNLVCEIQSYVTTYSSLVSFFLTMMTALHISTTVVKKPDIAERTRLVLYNAVSWTIPVVIIAVAGKNGVLGPSDKQGTGPWCWIRADISHTALWQWVTGKGWEIACFLVTTSMYILLKFYLKLKHKHERFNTVHTSLRDEDQNFLYVFLVFYIIRIWGTVRFLISALRPSATDDHMYMKVLLHFQAFGDPAQAFCNCILFCLLDKTVRKSLFGKCFCRPCKYEEMQESFEDYYNSTDKTDSLRASRPLSGRKFPIYGSVENKDVSTNSHDASYEEISHIDVYGNSPTSTPCRTSRGSPVSYESAENEKCSTNSYYVEREDVS